MLKTLQAGRALAALGVVAFHLSNDFGKPRYGGLEIGESFTRHLHLGVDFFFVLSGFIILSAHGKDIGWPARWPQYVWRRFSRVYPIYWLYTAIVTVLLLLGLGRVTQPPIGWAAWLSDFSLIRFSPDRPPLLVAWTLFHEIAFYAAFSLLILNRKLGVAVMAAWAVTCAALYQFPTSSGFSGWAVYTSGYNLEFFLGMAAYGLYRRGAYPRLLMGMGAAVLIGAMVLAEHFGRVEHGLFGAGFALAIAGATIAETRGALTAPSGLVAIGGASYTLYLIHIPVIGLLLKAVAYLGAARFVPGAVIWWAVFALTVALSHAAWRLIEDNMQATFKAFAGGNSPGTGSQADRRAA